MHFKRQKNNLENVIYYQLKNVAIMFIRMIACLRQITIIINKIFSTFMIKNKRNVDFAVVAVKTMIITLLNMTVVVHY